MTGKGRFLIFGIVAILVASSALLWSFTVYEVDSVHLALVPDDLEGGAAPTDNNYDLPIDEASRLDIGSDELPWEGGLVTFVLLSSTVMLILFARLREEDVLNGVRKEIFEYISENPGEHLAGITRQFGMSSSSARHHLDVLEWSDRIVSHKSGKQKHFYPNRNGYRQYTSGFEYKEIMAILKNDTCRGMVKVIINNEKANQKMIASALHIHPSTVNWHAKRLRGAQIIFKSRDGKDIHYSLNPELDLVNVISLIEGASS
ncbi:MAG: hypothetical protein KAR56_02035 [Thermoplasmata archaeon]|nr:hypothetical protein [Thermoplasmata archaeon]